jgi:cobalt-zinc-cadmium resistance protein CzcA
MPLGVTPVLAPPSTGLGEVFQYTLDHPSDRNRALTIDELTERRAVQDWIVRPMLRSIPGVAEINTQGGYSREYQVLVNPERLRHYQISLQDVYQALARNNANSGGGQLPSYAERYLIRGLGLITKPDDISKIILKEVKGIPVFIKNVAEVTVGSEIRQGVAIKNGDTESVAGIIQMIRGGNAREIVNRIKIKVAHINDNKLSYTHNIADDNKIQLYKLYERTKKNKGKVVSRDGVKYVLLNNKLYDYFSYKNAGVLISV